MTRASTRPAPTTAAIASQPRALAPICCADTSLHRANAAPEEALGPEVQDEQEGDEDADVLELEGQDEQRERLHEPDDHAPDERARNAPEPAEDDGHEHQHDEVDGDVRLD